MKKSFMGVVDGGGHICLDWEKKNDSKGSTGMVAFRVPLRIKTAFCGKVVRSLVWEREPGEMNKGKMAGLISIRVPSLLATGKKSFGPDAVSKESEDKEGEKVGGSNPSSY